MNRLEENIDAQERLIEEMKTNTARMKKSAGAEIGVSADIVDKPAEVPVVQETFKGFHKSLYSHAVKGTDVQIHIEKKSPIIMSEQENIDTQAKVEEQKLILVQRKLPKNPAKTVKFITLEEKQTKVQAELNDMSRTFAIRIGLHGA